MPMMFLKTVLPEIRHPLPEQLMPLSLAFAVLPEITHPLATQKIPKLGLPLTVLPEITHTPSQDIPEPPDCVELFAVQPSITLLSPPKIPFPFLSVCMFLTRPNPLIAPFSTVTPLCPAELIPIGMVEVLPGPVIKNPFKSMVTLAALTLIALVLTGTVRLPVRR